MKIPTQCFGEIEVEEHQMLHLPGGIVPFPEEEYVLVTRAGEAPFAWLQCLQRPDLAFVVISPEAVCGPPALPIAPEIKQELELDDGEQALVLCLVVVGEQPEQSTVNLLAPLVINPRTGHGIQLILNGDMSLIRVPVFALEQQALAA